MRWKLAVIALLACVLVPSPSLAFTLVLRGGDRIDIGEFYWISGSAVKWVTAAGERRTVELSRIDMDTTARQNGESVTAFVDRAIRRGLALSPPAPMQRPALEPQPEALTITTADLAPFREERERDAAARQTAPGVLPPVGVPRNEEPEYDAYQASVEERWREEARELRTQLDAEVAQIDSLRYELAYRDANPLKFRFSAAYNYGRGATVVDRRGRVVYPSYGYGSGSTYNRADEEYAQMNSRLIDIEIAHQGTVSRWNAFLERARRAGVPPGWLRE